MERPGLPGAIVQRRIHAERESEVVTEGTEDARS